MAASCSLPFRGVDERPAQTLPTVRGAYRELLEVAHAVHLEHVDEPGDVPADATSTHRMATSGEPASRDFFVAVVDDVVLAALGTAGR